MMNNTLIAFLLIFIAVFSTMLGVLVIYIKSKNHNKIIMASLSFAAGVMITVSITDLIPESILLLGNNLKNSTTIIISILAIVLGIIISMIIDYYLPDKPISNTKDKSLLSPLLFTNFAFILITPL